MALEREGVELVIENLSSYLLGLNSAADAAENLSFGLRRMGPAGVIASAGLNTAIDAAERFTGIAEQIAGSLEKIALAAGVAFGAAGSLGLKGASEIQRSLTIVQGITGATADQMGELQTKVLQVSSDFGVSANEVSQAAQLYIKAGGSISGAMDGALASIAQLKVIAPNLGTEQATNAIITLANNFKISSQQAADAIVQLSKTSTLSFNSIVEALRQIGPEAANIGVPLSDVTAALSLLTQRGLTGTQAGTQLRQMFIDLTRPSKDAADELNRVGISLFDQNGKVRPLVDLFGDLNRAYGQTATAAGQASDFERAYGLAVDFKSRAQIAANIIAADGVQKFNELKREQGDITALTLYGLVTQTTSFQLDRLKNSLENIAITIVGPLNVALGRGLTQLNNLIQAASNTGVFKTLGDAILAVASGQGFGQLEEQIHNLTNDQQLLNFTNGLLGSLLAVRDGIVSSIVPAFENLGSVIATTVSNVDFTSFFSKLAASAEAVATAVGAVVERVAGFISTIAEGGPAAQRLQNILSGLATFILGTLFISFASIAIPLAIDINILEKLGEAAGSPITALATLATALSDFADFAIKFGDVVSSELRAAFLPLSATLELAAASTYISMGRIEDAIGLISDATEKFKATPEAFDNFGRAVGASSESVQEAQDSVDKYTAKLESLKQRYEEVRQTVINSPTTSPDALRDMNALRDEIDKTTNELQTQQDVLRRLGIGSAGVNTNALRDLQQMAAQTSASLTKIQEGWNQGMDVQPLFDKAEADLNGLVAFARETAANLRTELSNINTGPTTTAGAIVDPKLAKQAADEAQRIAESYATRIAESEQQTRNRLIDIDTGAADRQLDIERSLSDRREQIVEQTNRQVDRSNRDFQQQQDERAQDQTLQRSLEENRRSWDQYFNAIDFLRNEDERKTEQIRSRDRQDQERNFNIQQQIAEQAHQQDLARQDELYARAQALQGVQFSRKQQDALRNFQEDLDKTTRLHNLQQELARATTPQERSNIQQRFAQSEEDRKFNEQQQTKLRGFQQQQENQATTFRDAQQDASFNRRAAQARNEIDYRNGLETARIEFTRGLDDKEFNYRNGLDILHFQQNLQRQDQLHSLQLGQQDEQNAITSARELQRHTQQIIDYFQEANYQAQLADINANKSNTQLQEQTQKNILQATQAAVNSQLNATQSAIDSLTSFQEKNGPSAVVTAQINQLNTSATALRAQLNELNQQLQQNVYDPNKVFNNVLPFPAFGTAGQQGVPTAPLNYTPPTTNMPPWQNVPGFLRPGQQETPVSILPNSVTAISAPLIQYLNSPQYRQQFAQGFADGMKLIGTLPVKATNPTIVVPNVAPQLNFDTTGHQLRDFRG